MTTHYDTLGVPPDADAATIKKAYQRKVKKLHPDRQGGDHDAMAQANKAYRVLSDEAARLRYDQTGQSDDAPPFEAKVREILIAAINKAVEDGSDPVAFVRGKAMEIQQVAGVRMGRAQQKIKSLTKLIKRVRSKSGSTLMHDIINRQIQNNQAARAEAEEAMRVGEELRKQIEDFVVEPEPQAAEPHQFNRIDRGPVFIGVDWGVPR